MNPELEEYGKKRHFGRTAEPPPQATPGAGPLVFVVQKHRARRLHYDFRLELDGVLKSWSIPKGPSADPEVKRLAVMVEDHPIDYASFEGQIPQGEYGAGEVVVWDSGTYSPDEKGRLLFHDRAQAQTIVREGLTQGKLSLLLRGHKLKGSWSLVKVKRGERDWLLLKHRDEQAQAGEGAAEDEHSVLSGRTLEDVKAGRPPAAFTPSVLNPVAIPGARPATFPEAVPPMLAHLAEAPFSGPEWLFEPKLDGYRVISYLRDGKVRLISRGGVDVTRQYAVLEPSLARQPASELVLDGEIVALESTGRQCFQCLQQYLRSQHLPASDEAVALVYYVFDILHLDGYDLRGATLQSRKKLLDDVLLATEHVRPVVYLQGEGKAMYDAAVKNGLEGVMAKRIESRYESGRRSGDWLKVKAVRSDEFIIGGYTRGEGSRAGTFGALLLGQFDSKGKLAYVGHVGTGFDEPALADLYKRLEARRTEACPFAEVPPANAPATWVKPELVAEVKFSERTRDGRLRIPVFLRLREDKPAREVQTPEAAPAPTGMAGPKAITHNDPVAEVLRQLRAGRDELTLLIGGDRVALTNLDKTLWPATGARAALTKRDLLIYLATVSPHLLSHLRDRPITMSRYPDGIGGEHFWQKHWESQLPGFVQTVDASEEKGARGQYLVCNNLSTLLWLGQMANIEFHAWFSRTAAGPDVGADDPDRVLDYPDFVIFDIDPYVYSGRETAGAEPELNRAGFERACAVALELKELLDGLSLPAYVKTSGKTGLHVHVPIIRNQGYRATRSVAQAIGRFLARRSPAEVTVDWAVRRRQGKVFLDYGQNVRGKTLACAYSPRPTSEATVSLPLRWDELKGVYPTDFTIISAPERLEPGDDPWADILSTRADLEKTIPGSLAQKLA